MSSALCVFIHASETGHAEGVLIAPSRGRSVEFPFGRELPVLQMASPPLVSMNVLTETAIQSSIQLSIQFKFLVVELTVLTMVQSLMPFQLRKHFFIFLFQQMSFGVKKNPNSL